ncbi:MAG TPA: branched-chain amino acid transaminase [Chloroflexi bacterium]|nr:branched-chain amino acid transaminase [Chloroflexota bacterium]
MALPGYAYFEGNIVPYGEAKVGVATHALNYGTAAFGGVRAYWNPDEEQLFIFRPRDHFIRLLNSAKLILAEIPHTPESLIEIALELLRVEGYREDVYIRPLIYKAEEGIGVRLHDLRDEITIFALPFTRYVDRDDRAHVTISSWRRIDDNAVPARGKISGAYVNSALIKTDAMRAGFDEALVLTNEGHISEGSAENVFMLRDGVLVTPPITDNILEGITRRTIITLARELLGLEVVERPIDRTEVYLCEELFLTGTAAQVTAVTRVDHRPIGSGDMGPVTARLRQAYQDVVRGRLPAYRDWNEPVYQKESSAAG